MGAFLQDLLWGQPLEPFSSHTLDLANLKEPDWGSIWPGQQHCCVFKHQWYWVAFLGCLETPEGLKLHCHSTSSQGSEWPIKWPCDHLSKEGVCLYTCLPHQASCQHSLRAHSWKMRPTKTKGKRVSSFCSFIASVIAAWVAKSLNPFRIPNLRMLLVTQVKLLRIILKR